MSERAPTLAGLVTPVPVPLLFRQLALGDSSASAENVLLVEEMNQTQPAQLVEVLIRNRTVVDRKEIPVSR